MLVGGSSPRVRGTLPMSVWPRILGHGSSPRVRGTLPANPLPTPLQRFIPACAGNTMIFVPLGSSSFGSSPRVRGTREHRRSQRHPIPVHPRVCGEHQMSVESRLRIGGSSPRVRGTPACPEPPASPDRFIPACAGNTLGASAPRHSHAVHPRVCGEHHRGIGQAHHH